MSFRIAWKPYMYSQTLPHLLGGVRAPALVVWGDDDQVVPPSAGEALCQGAAATPARDRQGAAATASTWSSPTALAALVTTFVHRTEREQTPCT